MPRPRQRLIGWHYNDQRQEITTPTGRVISLYEIATMLYDQVCSRVDLSGPWAGWKIRGNKLMPPHSGRNGPVITPENARLFARWVNEPSADSAPRTPPAGRPRLTLVRTSSR